MAKVHDKDREIAKLHALLEKSFKEVTVEGILTASQLETKTKQLAKFKKPKTIPHAHKDKHNNPTRNTPNGNDDRPTNGSVDSSPFSAIDDISSIDTNNNSNTPAQTW